VKQEKKRQIDDFIGSMHFSMHFFSGMGVALIRLVPIQGI
jgi:hypothetical protein